MISQLDPVILARIQFAFTISFHILFPAFTIGLASWLTVVEWRWLKTGKKIYEEVYRQWVKIFAVAFGMGVVSGLVMAYQFGTNWSGFSDSVGNVLGPLLGYEVLTAFFLEASFLGIMLFGWGKVSRNMHFASTAIVAIGTLISAFWILSADSWMQTPQGFEVGPDGRLFPTDWLAVILNPSFPWRFMHMLTGAFLTTAFVVGGVGAYYLWTGRHRAHAKVMFRMAMIMAIFVAPVQLILGDFHGLNTLHYQPAKVAAMEGIWETETGAGLRLFAWPNQAAERNDFEIKIPHMASLILTHEFDGLVEGLKKWPAEDRPPVAIVFWSFRVMAGIGMLMILTGVFALYLRYRKRMYDTRWFQAWCMFMTPMGFVAVLAGWFVTEIGRQPFLVYHQVRTAGSVSPVLGDHLLLSLIAFIGVYAVVFGAGLFYITQLIRKGPQDLDDEERYYAHGEEHTFVEGITHMLDKKD